MFKLNIGARLSIGDVLTKKEYQHVLKAVDSYEKSEHTEQTDKYFLVHVCENYDGFEFREKVLVRANSREELLSMSEKEKVNYGHEDSGSEVTIEDAVPLTSDEADVLSRLGL
jgi:hypothetical protein